MSEVQPANIGLVVGANIDPLRRELAQGARSVQDFSNTSTTSLGNMAYQTGALLGKVAKSFAVMGAAGVAGLTAITVAGANFIDDQNKLARQLGGTIDGINALQYAADLSGIEISSLSENIRKMNAVLANPSENTNKMLASLGLSADALLKMDVDERIATLADRFKELNYSLAQSDAAFAELGLKGKDITKLMLEGGDAIREAREELRAWGFSINDIDAANIENANDSFSKAHRILDGLGQVIAAKVAPYIADLILKFTESAKAAGGAGNLIKKAFDPVFATLVFIVNAVAGVGRAFEVAGATAATAFLGIKATVLATAAAILEGPTKAVNLLIDGFDKLTHTTTEFRLPTTLSDSFKAEAETAVNAVAEGTKAIQELLLKPLPGTAIEDWANGVKTSVEQAKASAEGFNPGDSTGIALPVDFTEANEGLDLFGEKLDQETRAKMDAFSESLKMPTGDEIYEAMADDQMKLKDHWDEMNRIAVEGAGAVAQSVAEHFGNAAGSTAAAGKSMLESFSQSSRKMFEVNKAWGIADAIISTAQGIAKGVALGWPAGIPAVAWAVASGAAQIAKIKSQTFGGGGSAPATGGGGMTSAPVNNAQPSPEESRGGTLRIEGFDPSHLYRGEQLQNFAGALEEFWQDGGGKGRVIYAGKK